MKIETFPIRLIGLLFCLFCWATLPCTAQYVGIQPTFPTADGDITLTFDLKLSKDARATGLLDKTSDVYLWAWGGSDVNNRQAEFGPSGQSSFSQPFDPGKLTSLGADKWSIKLKPSQYLNVTGGKKLTWMGVLVKNGNGTNQTEDFTFVLYDNKLNVSFLQPTEESFFVKANSSVVVQAKASQKCTMQLSINGATQSPLFNTDSLFSTVGTGGVAGTRRTVKITAQTNTETATDEFTFTVQPIPLIAPLPNGIKDGINYLSSSQVTLSLFAPNKNFIYVLGDFNNWTPSTNFLMNQTPDGQRYWLQINNLEEGKEYAFEYWIDDKIAVADPYAEKLLDKNNDRFIPASTYPDLLTFPTQARGNIVSVLQTNQKPYEWKVSNFKRPDNQDLVIYELLVRDFIGTQNYQTLADTLPYLKKLGVNCIELMPIMEFTGNDSWGYNPIFYMAPDKAYGTKDNLKKFIDRCHENGMAVVLDIVLNQADYEFPYLKMYWDGTKPSKDSPMFNQQATHPFSVFFDFNHESPATKDLVDRICQHWLQEYRFDGYRFDLSKGFTQKDAGNDVSRWSSYDASRVAIWKRIYDKIRSYDASAYIILEHFADDQEERELADYGMMLWANLNGDFRNAIKGNTSSINRLAYPFRNFTKPHLIGYMESHDEERLMWDVLNNGTSAGTYSTRNLTTASERIKAAAALFFGTPGPKMIWQFGELGYDIAIDQNGRTGKKPIKWDYLQVAERQKLYKVFAELIKLKTTQKAFRTSTFSLSGSAKLKQLTLDDASMKVNIVANFDVEEYANPITFQNTGKWYDFFTGDEVNITNVSMPIVLKPGEFHIYTTVKLPKPESGLVPWSAYSVVTAMQDPDFEDINIAPNPVRDRLRIELKSQYRGEVMLRLNDVVGKQVNYWKPYKNQEKLVQELLIQHLSDGMYLLEIEQGGQRSVKKIVKQ